MSRELLAPLTPEHWQGQKQGSSPSPNPTAGNSASERVQWLQGLNDLIRRPAMNRQAVQTSATAVTCNGAVQSSGIGLANPLQPKRYAEFTVKARVTLNINSVGPAYVYVCRTLGAIPVNGAAMNAGDVIVGGDGFMGGTTTSGVNESGALSFIDTGLDVTKKYNYYLAVYGPNGNVMNLVNSSQLFVLERS